jgi:glyoxylase-like metal-dependent hydrolase (beta-lactamase superfamily II)
MTLFRILLFALLLFPLAAPALAKVTLGVVPQAQSRLSSEGTAREFARLLEKEMGEEVAVQFFKNEKELHEWVSRYRLVDLAVFSGGYLARQLPGEFFQLDHPWPGPGDAAEYFVARQGLYPWMLKKLQKTFAALARSGAAAPILQRSSSTSSTAPSPAPPPAPPPPEPPPPDGEREAPTPEVVAAPPTEFLVQEILEEAAKVETPSAVPVTEQTLAATDQGDAVAEDFAPPPPSPSAPAPPVPLALPHPLAQSVPAAASPPPTGEAVMNMARGKDEAKRAPAGDQPSYTVEQLAENIYAALTLPGGRASSNAFFVVGPEYVVAGGAHMSKEAVNHLVTAIATVTDKPLRHFVLTHHHRGYHHIDYDFPAGVDLLISWPTWRTMDEEKRKPERPAFFFTDGLTLKLGETTVIMTNMGRAHSEGDTLVFFPEAEILFTSDLAYAESVGYLGDGYMEDWLLALEFIERLGAKKVIPGFGPPSDNRVIVEFKNYFRALVSEVLKHIERGDSLERTVRTLRLPDYAELKGYEQFLGANVRRAYLELNENFAP